jgi:hypothetical protein
MEVLITEKLGTLVRWMGTKLVFFSLKFISLMWMPHNLKSCRGSPLHMYIILATYLHAFGIE